MTSCTYSDNEESFVLLLCGPISPMPCVGRKPWCPSFQYLKVTRVHRWVDAFFRYQKLKEEKRRQRRQQLALQRVGSMGRVGMGLRRWRNKSSVRVNLGRTGSLSRHTGQAAKTRRRSLNSQVVRSKAFCSVRQVNRCTSRIIRRSFILK